VDAHAIDQKEEQTHVDEQSVYILGDVAAFGTTKKRLAITKTTGVAQDDTVPAVTPVRRLIAAAGSADLLTTN